MAKKVAADYKNLSKRRAWWFVMTYLEPHEFEYALNKATHWVYICHDMEGPQHYHVLLHYDNVRTGKAVLKDFFPFDNQNSMCEGCYDPVACYEYLTHVNDPDKYQYRSDRIVSHNPVYWEHFLPDVRNRPEADFIEDLIYSNDIDLVYMAKKYGRDFMKNYKSYLEFRYTARLDLRFNNE